MTATAAPTLPGVLYAYELTQDNKATFIELIRAGHKPDAAAKEIGSTGTQFRRLRNPDGEHYDPDHAAQFHQAINSEEHHAAFLERIRSAVWNRAEAGSDRMLEKLSLIYDPDWEPLRNPNLNVNVNMVARVLPYISDDVLAAAIEAAERDQVEPPQLRSLPKPAEEDVT